MFMYVVLRYLVYSFKLHVCCKITFFYVHLNVDFVKV